MYQLPTRTPTGPSTGIQQLGLTRRHLLSLTILGSLGVAALAGCGTGDACPNRPKRVITRTTSPATVRDGICSGGPQGADRLERIPL